MFTEHIYDISDELYIIEYQATRYNKTLQTNGMKIQYIKAHRNPSFRLSTTNL